MKYSYNISQSSEPNRLMATFDDRDFLVVLASQMLNRVGSRRDEANIATHLVFAPELEADVRTWIGGKAEWLIAAPERAARADAFRITEEARYAELDRVAAEKAIKKQAKRLAAGADVKVSFRNRYVFFPYAKGAPMLMRAAGATWDKECRGWWFTAQSEAAVQDAMPEIKALVVEQIARDTRKCKAMAKARQTVGSSMDVGARWNMSDDEIMEDLGYLPRTEAGMEQAYGTSDY